MDLIEYCNKYFSYDENTGLLTLKERRSRYDRCKVGEEVGTTNDGYRKLSVLGKIYTVHRLIWMMVYGEIPEGLVIDHRDGDGLNNRLYNLRLATNQQNIKNRTSISNTSSKYLGVSWKRGKWEAAIGVNGKSIYLGRFDSEVEAAMSYDKAATLHHGEFANLNEAQ